MKKRKKKKKEVRKGKTKKDYLNFVLATMNIKN